ncbi:sugar transferase [bacterium]|nr:sugar transferase [bacterium]
MRKRSELLFNLLLIPLDAGALIASWVLAYIIRVEYTLKPTVYNIPGYDYLGAMVALVPVSVALFAVVGLYSFDSTRSRWVEYGKVVAAVSASTMFLIIVDFFTTKPLFPSKAVVIYGLVISLLSVIVVRFVLNSFQRWLFRFGIGRRRVVVIGSGEMADNLTYAYQKQRGYVLAGIIPHAKSEYTKLEALLKQRLVDEVVLAEYDVSAEKQLQYITLTHEHHVGYKFVPTIAGLFQTRSQSELVAELPLIEVVRTPLDGWWRIYKAILDYCMAIVVTLILTPIMLAIALVIKLTDRGPVFYRHERIGRDGKKIQVWKFRSMYTKFSTGAGYSGKSDKEILEQLGSKKLAAEFAKEQKLKDDPRVTPIGKFLRKTSLDELPQIINVLRGELSIIGPRPVVEAELKRYGDKRATFLLIKPGITGLWQVSGRNDISYENRVKLDVYYVEHWSAWQDIRILFRTVLVIFGRKGY